MLSLYIRTRVLGMHKFGNTGRICVDWNFRGKRQKKKTEKKTETRGPWALTSCLRTNLVICQSSRSCTYTPFLPQGLKLSLFSLYEQQFPRYLPIFKNAIFGHETCHWPMRQKLHMYIASFYPKGAKLSLLSLYGQLTQSSRAKNVFCTNDNIKGSKWSCVTSKNVMYILQLLAHVYHVYVLCSTDYTL